MLGTFGTEVEVPRTAPPVEPVEPLVPVVVPPVEPVVVPPVEPVVVPPDVPPLMPPTAPELLMVSVPTAVVSLSEPPPMPRGVIDWLVPSTIAGISDVWSVTGYEPGVAPVQDTPRITAWPAGTVTPEPAKLTELLAPVTPTVPKLAEPFISWHVPPMPPPIEKGRPVTRIGWLELTADNVMPLEPIDTARSGPLTPTVVEVEVVVEATCADATEAVSKLRAASPATRNLYVFIR